MWNYTKHTTFRGNKDFYIPRKKCCNDSHETVHRYLWKAGLRWIFITMASLVAQLVNNPSAMQGTPIRFLGQEDQLEKG